MEIRDQVPSQHRAQFDALLAEARSQYRLRDERVLFGDCWSSGVQLEALHLLASACERMDRGPWDLEWAFDEHRLFLLQCRPVTGAASSFSSPGPLR